MNPLSLLSALVPAFIPLLAFIVAEALFGETIGLIVGITIGIGEFIWVLAREKRADPFVAADTALIALAGGVSLAFGNDIFFKLKPAVVEFVLGAAMGLLLVLPERFLEGYFARVLRGAALPSGALPALRKSIVLMVCLLVLHSGLTAWAAFNLSDSGWGFVSGGLFYILFALVFLVQLVTARLQARRQGLGPRAPRGVEVLPLVDDEGKITGSAPRPECHQGPGKLHPVVRLHLVDSEGRLFLQKRSSDKEAEPGKWDAAMAGHVSLGEDLETAVARELQEELGVSALAFETAGAKAELLFRYRQDSALESELAFVFAAKYGGPFAPSLAEVADFRAWTREELELARGKGSLSAMLERDLEILDKARGADPGNPPQGAPDLRSATVRPGILRDSS
jgi:isopentenyldiphosphate isomerase/intracellular septation protein A